MRKWLGIGLLVLSVLVLFTGWATWTEIGDEGEQFARAKVVTASELQEAAVGDLVLVEGTAQQQYEGPVSGEPAAWYRLTRVQRWQEHPGGIAHSGDHEYS